MKQTEINAFKRLANQKVNITATLFISVAVTLTILLATGNSYNLKFLKIHYPSKVTATKVLHLP